MKPSKTQLDEVYEKGYLPVTGLITLSEADDILNERRRLVASPTWHIFYAGWTGREDIKNIFLVTWRDS